MKHYTIMNIHTKHIMYEHDDLKATINMWHKIPKRKKSTLCLIDNTTGEIIKMK